jgi:cyclopropane fatty-acyl-phospholipid synthase-like methyltransferase
VVRALAPWDAIKAEGAQPGAGKLLLDIGCSWGRWSISAARNGWCVVGIDPSLGAIMAARRAFFLYGIGLWIDLR